MIRGEVQRLTATTTNLNPSISYIILKVRSIRLLFLKVGLKVET